MRFALITDQHFGPPGYFGGKLRKLTQHAAELTERFVSCMNGIERPDLVINLGDVVEDESHELDLERYGQFVALMSALNAPVLHVAGNHDCVHLSQDDLRGLWKRSGPLFYSHDLGGVHWVVLHTEDHGTSVRISDQQLQWLEQDLESSALSSIVLMHHPASEMRLEGNLWFEKAPHICRVAERRRLRAILERSQKVIAVFNGHVHWNHLDVIEGIPYVTVQSLTENVEDDAPGNPAAAWAVCNLEAHELLVRIFGSQPARYQFQLRAGSEWNPLDL